MSSSNLTWYGYVNEDGSFSILSRVTALQGTGEEVNPGEGPVLLQADVSTITCKVFSLGTNKNNENGTEITPAPTLTVSGSIYDTLQLSGWTMLGGDDSGYNFRHDVSPTYVPTGGEWYLLEYKITLTGGGIIWLRPKVKTEGLQTS